MRRILLIGISGVFNYGCEAIVRGTVEVLKKNDPNCEIIYASSNAEDDKKRLVGCDVEVIDRPIRKWTVKNILKKIFHKLGIKIHYCYDSVAILENIDEVYSIGGDIYTLGANGNFQESLPLFGDKCISRGIKYYLWGCSIGPFTKNKIAEEFYTKHLKNVTKIYAREKETVNYLKSLGIQSNVELITDPAFFVAPKIQQTEHSGEIKKIGLNLSPLSSLHFYESLEDSIKKQTQIVVDLLDHYNCHVILLPHVVSKHINDDDFRYLKAIYEELPVTHKSRVELISNDPGFLGIKNELLRCDVVLAARMHCAVNAATAKVPTIFLSYSSKAIGMCEHVYGTRDFVMGLDKLNIENIKKMISDLFIFLKK